MSWMWSHPPPSDEEPTTRPQEDIHIDPYAQDITPSEEFGTAFSDDIDYTSSPTDSFDLYSPETSAPTVDFNQMARINPSIVSPRTALRTRDASPAVDYVFADDYKDIRKKSGAEQLTYLAGTSYLTGAVIGGSRGFVEGLQASKGKGMRLRLNAVLNGTGKRGSYMANRLGVLALAFSLSESALYNYTNDESLANYMLAGAAAGGLYKSTRGPRMAALWAVGGAVTAFATVYASRQGYYGKGLQGIL